MQPISATLVMAPSCPNAGGRQRWRGLSTTYGRKDVASGKQHMMANGEVEHIAAREGRQLPGGNIFDLLPLHDM